jgi:hypothetical protein
MEEGELSEMEQNSGEIQIYTHFPHAHCVGKYNWRKTHNMLSSSTLKS